MAETTSLRPLERLYIVQILKGMWITMRHLIRNVLSQGRNMRVIEYPDVRKPMAERYRGAHRLTTRPDGKLKCVACMCCSTACPAKCITIVADEDPEDPIEKYPVRFEIDMLRCIYCGFCVEACPKDAIRMDTGIYEINAFNRQDMIHSREYMTNLMDGFKAEALEVYKETPEEAPPGYMGDEKGVLDS